MAYLPPVSGILHEVFEGRKPHRVTEVALRHRIEPQAGESLEVEEHIFVERGARPHFLWKVPAQGLAIPGVWERTGYSVGDRSFPSRSGAFLKYLLASSADELLNQLLSEGFVRRDQLQQFKPDFTFEGEPNSWNPRENYIRHDDIYLKKLSRGFGIAVVGLDDGNNGKTVYFDPSYHGVRRLEWKEGQTVSAWEFDVFLNASHQGYYPRALTFEKNGESKIRSELLFVREVTARDKADLRQAYSRAGQVPSNVENALRWLLSYR